MKAALFRGKDHPLKIEEVKKPKPVKDQVLVRLKYAALNHRDLWLMQEQAQQFPQGVILGSDGSGIVEDVGEDADSLVRSTAIREVMVVITHVFKRVNFIIILDISKRSKRFLTYGLCAFCIEVLPHAPECPEGDFYVLFPGLPIRYARPDGRNSVVQGGREEYFAIIANSV